MRYVVQVEFGADLAVDVSPVGPHADYIVAILPGSNTAIVARPERQNYEIASSAAFELLALFGKRVPAELRQLAFALQEAAQSDGVEPPETRQLLSIAGKRLRALQPTLEPGLVVDAEVYVQARCAQNPESCFVGEGRRKMLAENPELLRRALEALTQAGLEAKMTPRLLALVEAQLEGEPVWREVVLERVASRLGKLGFRIVRAPYLPAPRPDAEWVGISYVNMLVVDEHLFVPTFGLGSPEERLLASFARRIGSRYKLHPIPARFALLNNGGVHCVFGLVRAPYVAPAPVSGRRASPAR